MAVRIFSGSTGPGGFYDDPNLEDIEARNGPFDGTATPNGKISNVYGIPLFLAQTSM